MYQSIRDPLPLPAADRAMNPAVKTNLSCRKGYSSIKTPVPWTRILCSKAACGSLETDKLFIAEIDTAVFQCGLIAGLPILESHF